ncbi:MAG: ABC transporter permease [Alphaproteobacteria bacterium]|nr:ABC transporter permease [Alphaproteobacteria bacterium]
MLPRSQSVAEVKLPLVLLCLLAAASFGAPLAAAVLGVDARSVDLLDRVADPSLQHPLGTDELGRDVLLRLLEGGRVSLAVGGAAALASAVLGTIIGLAAGYVGGWTDRVLMRLTDGVIALPLLALLIVLAALDLGKLGLPREFIQSEEVSVFRIIALATLVGWTTTARLVRGGTLIARSQDYVRAAQSLGASTVHVLRWHVLPNVVGPLLVATALSVGDIILLESVLSFLGLGIQPPMASWGNMLTNAQELIESAPLLAIYPGVMIFVTVICCNMFADALHKRLDPRQAAGA